MPFTAGLLGDSVGLPGRKRIETMLDAVGRHLYRCLLRGARKHDVNPALKALLSIRRSRLYDHNQGEWANLPGSLSKHEFAVCDALRSGLMQGGDYYAPEASDPTTDTK